MISVPIKITCQICGEESKPVANRQRLDGTELSCANVNRLMFILDFCLPCLAYLLADDHFKVLSRDSD